MLLKSKFATVFFCVAAMSTGAQAQPAAARHSAPQAPVEQPVKYQLLLASSLLLLMFGGRRPAPAEPWSKH
jgi:hypothetical protein